MLSGSAKFKRPGFQVFAQAEDSHFFRTDVHAKGIVGEK
jgi:hypothetical protein